MDNKSYDIAEKNCGERCLEIIGNPVEKLKGLCREACSHSKLFGDMAGILARKILDSWCGGLVGERGGLATYVQKGCGMEKEKVGEHAIWILTETYQMELKLIPELARALQPEIEEHVRQTVADEKRVAEEVEKEKENIRQKLMRRREEESETLSCTDVMVKREYLKRACEKTQQLFNPETAKGSGKMETWEVAETPEQTVVEYMVWKLILFHLGLEDAENDKNEED